MIFHWSMLVEMEISRRGIRTDIKMGQMSLCLCSVIRKRKMYLSVEDSAELFGLSVSFAYRVVERMNADLASKNYYVILGRVPTRYVEDKIYGLEHVEQYLKEDKAV